MGRNPRSDTHSWGTFGTHEWGMIDTHEWVVLPLFRSLPGTIHYTTDVPSLFRGYLSCFVSIEVPPRIRESEAVCSMIPIRQGIVLGD